MTNPTDRVEITSAQRRRVLIPTLPCSPMSTSMLTAPLCFLKWTGKTVQQTANRTSAPQRQGRTSSSGSGVLDLWKGQGARAPRHGRASVT
jgi:hypothetical protein